MLQRYEIINIPPNIFTFLYKEAISMAWGPLGVWASLVSYGLEDEPSPLVEHVTGTVCVTYGGFDGGSLSLLCRSISFVARKNNCRAVAV